MKNYIVCLTHTPEAFLPLMGAFEVHETQCPNLARQLLRLNKGSGAIMHAKDKTSAEWTTFKEYMEALKVTWTTHEKQKAYV
jgi:hypothetical protein